MFLILLIFMLFSLLFWYWRTQKRDDKLIQAMLNHSFYSESEATLELFTQESVQLKKGCLVFLDESLLLQSLDKGIVKDKQAYKKMDGTTFIANIKRFSDIAFIVIYYGADSHPKKCALKRETFFACLKKAERT